MPCSLASPRLLAAHHSSNHFQLQEILELKLALVTQHDTGRTGGDVELPVVDILSVLGDLDIDCIVG